MLAGNQEACYNHCVIPYGYNRYSQKTAPLLEIFTTGEAIPLPGCHLSIYNNSDDAGNTLQSAGRGGTIFYISIAWNIIQIS
jgi:hypothetical protein